MGLGPGGSGNTGGQANDGGATAGGALGGHSGANAGTPGSGTSGMGDGGSYSGYGAGLSDIGDIAKSDMPVTDKAIAIGRAILGSKIGSTLAGKVGASLLGGGIPGMIGGAMIGAAVRGDFGGLNSAGLGANFGDPAGDPNGNQAGGNFFGETGQLGGASAALGSVPGGVVAPLVPTGNATQQANGFLSNPYGAPVNVFGGLGNATYVPAAQAPAMVGNFNPNAPNFQFAPGDPGAVAQQHYFQGIV